MLTSDEHLRYARQICLPEIGLSGQRKLKSSSVAIVGMGGLGSPVALYLAAAGIGHLGLIDFDVVGLSNLHRQILHTDAFIGQSKIESAVTTLKECNPHVHITPHNVRLNSKNAIDLLQNYDIVADCSDNFSTRYLVNDACVFLKIPNVYGSVYQFEGQLSILGLSDGPCYRCIHPIPPDQDLIPSCAESGVLGVLPGVIGTLQATEVLKLFLNCGRSLIGQMLLIDTLTSKWETVSIAKRFDCELCGESPTITTLREFTDLCESVDSMTVEEFRILRSSSTPFFLLDVRQTHEASELSMAASQIVPVEELSDRISEIHASINDQIIVHCQTGIRSIQATHILRNAGFKRVKSLQGGILAWLQHKNDNPSPYQDETSDPQNNEC